ncbi:MAG: potassium transporter [Spirochaetales bacterium]|nr:potassium transporter [Spirochaetales bacterium]
MPFSWNGDKPLDIIDALFTSTSAICVTGLITVDTASYSFFGKMVILFLIQAGGLGIISFTTVFITLSARRISLRHRNLVKELYIDSIEPDPKLIIRQIFLMTMFIEFIGAFFLFIGFYQDFGINGIFVSLFHSVSAFCNAGFSLFSNNLENYVNNPVIAITIMMLIVVGGIGFVVLRDIALKFTKKKKKLTVHTKIVLITTLFLILFASVAYFSFEFDHAYKALSFPEKIMNSLFQSITPRTAGFNLVPQNSLSLHSKLFTLPLMFIGASSGSTGGGIKVSTFFIIVLMILWGAKRNNEIVFVSRTISKEVIIRALLLMTKVVILIFSAVLALAITETALTGKTELDLLSIIFESFSAFGTVGLSLGATPVLTTAGKVIIMILMFEGKAGLLSMVLTEVEPHHLDKHVDYPTGEVLIG